MKRVIGISIFMLAIFALFIACKDPVGGGIGDDIYTVTFDKNHSDASGFAEADPKTKTVTSPATTVGTLPTAPTRTTHNFVSWNTQADGNGSAFTASTTVTKNITVYAQWTPAGTKYAITFNTTGNVAGDSVSASPQSAEDGATITINYTLAGGYINNRIVFSGVEAAISEVNGAETGTRTYTVSAGDADQDDTITIIATFTHTNKNLDTIAFTENAIHKTYGDAAFTIAVSNSGQGTGAITYSSGHTDIATVDASTGEVTIVSAGIATITATKAADDDYEGTTASYALHIAPVQLTISGTTVTPTKTYDGNTTATVTADGALGGVISGDTVTVSASAAYNSANVSEANKITVTYTISGANAGGYAAPIALEITDGVSITKAAGATLSGSVETSAITSGSITIGAVTAPSNGQTVEYAIAAANTAPSAGWQDGLVFSGLIGSKAYYVFARAKGDDNHEAGAAISGGPFTTLAPPVPPTVVDFEDKTAGDTYSRVSGQGTASAAVVADPVNTGGKSLKLTSNNWNNGAIIPINLPFALKNYQSFTFRFNHISPSGTSNDGIWVYIMSTTSDLPNNQLGNSNATYTARLLEKVSPNYSATNQWQDFEIGITSLLSSTILNLQGDIFLVIGINANASLEYLLDDLTFNIKGDFVPSASISPTTATFVKATTSALYADIPVAMTLYGNTFSGVKNGETTISPSNTTYTVSGNTVELKKEYLAGQAVGDLTLTFVFNQGGNSDMVIKIVATDADLPITSYDFSTNPGGIWDTTVFEAVSGFPITTAWNTTYSALEVTLTSRGTGNNTGPLILKFNLGTKKLSDYQSIVVNVASGSSSGNNKNAFSAEVAPSNGTFGGIGQTLSNTRLGVTSGGGNGLTSEGQFNSRTFSLSALTDTAGTPGALTGEVKIAFGIAEYVDAGTKWLIKSVTLVE